MRTFWRTPFYVLCGTVVILLISNGSRQNFGLFLVPLSDDLGWGRAVFSVAIAVQNLVMGLAAPFIAAVGDKWGPIRVMTISGVLYAVGVFLISQSTTPELMTLSAGFVVGLGAAGIGMTLPLALVGRVAPQRRRSLWLGVATAGGSVGQFVFAPVSLGLMTGLGSWADAIMLLSIIIAVTIPLSLSLRAGATETLAKQGPQSLSSALVEAGGHRGFWLLAIGFYVCGFQVQFIGTHLPGFLADSGAAPWLAAWAIATIGIFNLIGTLGAGWLGDRLRKKYLLSTLYLLRAILFLIFLQVPVTEASVLVFSAALGVLWLSTVPLTSGIVAQVFGPRYMATLFSIVFLGHQLGSFTGVLLGGVLYDRTGSYDAAWWLATALGVAAALIHWPIDDKPVRRLALKSA